MMPFGQTIRSPWCKAVTFLLFVTVTAVCLIHQNRLLLSEQICSLRSQPLLEMKQIDPPEPKQSSKPEPGSSKKLEFPRLYEIPKCDAKNKTVPKNACMYMNAKMYESTRQTYLRLLKFWDEQATKYNWTYFMVFGTLLGSWRHHDLIPYDQDVDIFVEYKHRMEMVNKIEEQGRFIPKQMVHHKIRLHDAQNIGGSVFYDDVGRWYTPSIDMFFYIKNSTHIRRSDYPTYYVTKNTDIFPLHKRPLSTLMLPSPKDPLKHLVRFYDATRICKVYSSRYKKTDCAILKPYIPFVHRKWKNGKMEESLKLGEKVLQVKRLDEMKENIPLNPFTLASKRYTEKNNGY